MAASILFLLPVLALTPIPVQAGPIAYAEHPHTMQAQVVMEFTAAVNRYMEIHRLLESPMSSLTLGADPEQTARAREAHRKAIAEARIAMPRGDVFTPRVGAYVRRQIQLAAYWAYMAGDEVTVAAIERLPQLPNELEYRFVDRDLVLMDNETNLVVDVLKDALPPETATDWTEMCTGS